MRTSTRALHVAGALLTLFSPLAQAQPVSPASLATCPLVLELSEDLMAAVTTLPRDVSEDLPQGRCEPRTTMTMMLARNGMCRVGDVIINSVSVMTLDGKPIALMLGVLYNTTTHAELQKVIESRYALQPWGVFPGRSHITESITSITKQPGGTFVLLTRPSDGMRGPGLSLVKQIAPDHVAVVERDLNSCK